MIHELHIRNFAIIDDLRLTFGPGLNILTGETGAGKSIIIDAVGLLLGDRASAELVRAKTERAEIEATIFLSPFLETSAAVQQFLSEQGLDDPDSSDWLLLSREVRRNGRNICRINGRAVSLQILSELTARLVDVHGQGEHLSLLRPHSHIQLLDRYADLVTRRERIASLVRRLHIVRNELARLRQDARTMAQRMDLLSFQAEEIAAADLQPGEDSTLDSERRRLSNAEALLRLAQSSEAIINDGESEMPAAIDLIGEIAGRLDRLARIDPDMAETADSAQVLVEQLADLARSLQDYADSLEFNPERLEEVEDRLELIDGLRRKYGDTIEEIVAFGTEAQAELEDLGNWEAKTADLENEEKSLLQSIGTEAAELTTLRQAAGKTMATQMEHELNDLRMERARFGVSVTQREQDDGAYLPDGRRVAFDSTGVDRVEFLISANPGEPLKPLAKVASGGETARLMLALKSVLTAADATPTLIFDEIDQGIGGRVGAVVGQKLWGLTRQAQATSADTPTKDPKRTDSDGDKQSEMVSHQVLCITHLPQLAAFGDQHHTVNKQILMDGGQERTKTVVVQLAPDERIDELTQMLGAQSEAGRLSVKEMLEQVALLKTGKRTGANNSGAKKKRAAKAGPSSRRSQALTGGQE
jgi:DNA repair protein RecN (Recombination protein N)